MLLINQVQELHIISHTYKSVRQLLCEYDWEIISWINKSDVTRHINYWYESSIFWPLGIFHKSENQYIPTVHKCSIMNNLANEY